jgi:hypothetical protein
VPDKAFSPSSILQRRGSPVRFPSRTIFLVPIIFLLCSCYPPNPTPSALPDDTATPKPFPSATPDDTAPPKSTPKILADAFFFGHAYLDADGNGKIDPDDPGLGGARFEVGLSWGGGSVAFTGKDGSASIVIPGGLREKDWPVRARMIPPPDTSYQLVGPAEVVLEYPKSSADFLFVDSRQGE